jgi:tRNA pseudouridine55 synthase
VDKPAGPTSHDVVAVVRRALGLRAVGHTGTLDPFATGLLIVMVGGATRLARFLEREAKGYWAEAVLGVTTDTDDHTGRVLARQDVVPWPGRDALERALAGLVGPGMQRPPAYSAKRVRGRRSHELARTGRPEELAPVPVTVYQGTVLRWNPPVLEFRVAVSPGTYVRALARDLGDRLGMGAHLRALRREWIGPHRVEEAVPLEAVCRSLPLLAPLDLFPAWPRVALTAAEAVAVRQGRMVGRGGAAGAGEALLVWEDRLLAVAEAAPAGWQPRVVLGDA